MRKKKRSGKMKERTERGKMKKSKGGDGACISSVSLLR